MCQCCVHGLSVCMFEYIYVTLSDKKGLVARQILTIILNIKT